jgi:cation/acetate symporter
MIYQTSTTAVLVFSFFVAVVLGISFYLGSKAKSAKGYYAAHGQIPWFVNGVAFAGDYLSAASFLGICGLVAWYGYDGFLYSIGYLAGWVVALFVIAEPMKRLGRFTFADALDSKFNSRAIKLTAAISTLIVSIFYLIPQMVGAGALIKPLLGIHNWQLGAYTVTAHATGVTLVGGIVILIVVTAGMVSTTWVQFIKGSMLVVFCTILVFMILGRGLTTQPGGANQHDFAILPAAEAVPAGAEVIEPTGPWKDKPYVRVTQKAADGSVAPAKVWRKMDKEGKTLGECQTVTVTTDKASGAKTTYANGKVQGIGEGKGDLYPVGHVRKLAGDRKETGPLGPIAFFHEFADASFELWGKDGPFDEKTVVTTVYFPKIKAGADLLVPGGSPTFATLDPKAVAPKVRPFWENMHLPWQKIDFLSLMLALFCGTASLPHILIRYYTVKDQASARKSTVVGIAAIGFFYILTLYLGLGAMASGSLDVTNNTMAAPLLARSFGELPFAIISAIAFTTVLGTVSGLILAASGAVAHDIMESFLKIEFDDHAKVKAGKSAAVVVGVIAIVLGIVFEQMNPSFLVGWAFNIAASANLPALVMLLFWKKTTAKGMAAAITVGMVTSLAWILCSAQVYKDIYGYSAGDAAVNALVPFSQPGIVTIPLGFLVLVLVSLMTQPKPQPAYAAA